MSLRFFAIFSVLLLSACVPQQPQAPSLPTYVMASGPTIGLYYPISQEIAKMVNTQGYGFRIDARVGSGSVGNINAISAGESAFGFAQGDIADYAFRGINMKAFQAKPTPSIRAVSGLYPEVIHIFAHRVSNISSVSDLKGKRVYVGDEGSSTYFASEKLLQAFNLSRSDLALAKADGGVAPAVFDYIDGKLDAYIFVAPPKNEISNIIMKNTDSIWISLDDVSIRKIGDENPFFLSYVIPANTYPGIAKNTQALAIQEVWLASEAVPEEIVYKSLQATIGREAIFKTAHPALQADFSLQGATKGITIPWHPGAQRFFKEKGLLP